MRIKDFRASDLIFKANCDDLCEKKMHFNFDIPVLALIIGIPLIIAAKVAFVCYMRRRHATSIMNDILDEYDLVPKDPCDDCDCEDESECDCGCDCCEE